MGKLDHCSDHKICGKLPLNKTRNPDGEIEIIPFVIKTSCNLPLVSNFNNACISKYGADVVALISSSLGYIKLI
jgi:hypothetical protein